LIQVGGLGALGINLATLFRAQAAEKSPASGVVASKPIRSCILLFFYGGPSQLDTWDPKPDGPSQIRGEFSAIATTVPGLQFGEHLPRMAQLAHKLGIVRSMHHPMRNHNAAAVEALCGRTPVKGDLELLTNDRTVDFPCYGAMLSHLTRQHGGAPLHVALPHVMNNLVELPGQTAGFLGAAHDPLQITHDPNQADFSVSELDLPADLSLSRLEDRRSLLESVDQHSAHMERLAATQALNTYQERAFNLIASERVRTAFHIAREPQILRERYGRNKLGQSLLLARRLVEAGVRFVNVNDKVANGQLDNWDSHLNNFGRLKNDLLPPADQALSTLIEDLDQRGLLDSTLIVAMGEFGRTPKINAGGGRDHWPDCYSIVLAGGGIQGGSTYGASDKMGAYPAAKPVTPGDLAATLFWRLGLDLSTELHDGLGRPFAIANGKPLKELFA